MTHTAEHLSNSAPQSIERIRHHRIGTAMEECELMLEAGINANLIAVCGPTGVGKSTLGEFLVELEFKNQVQSLVESPGVVPAIRIEAPSSGEREFSWRLFFERIMNALEGDLDLPRSAYGVDPGTNATLRQRGPRPNRLADLRTAVERSLRHRQTHFIVVDEAAHLIRQCHPRRIEQQLDTLKSLSNECGVQWILLGSYDLFDLVSLSGQLARRTHVIHFSRYRRDNEADVKMFRACIVKLQKSMPVLQDLDLLKYTPVFMENTLGCIGTLRTVLVRLSLLVKKYGWSEDLLCSALLTEAQVTQILHEIVAGEERIAPGVQRSLALPSTHVAKKRVA
jgi:hypothetical protein